MFSDLQRGKYASDLKAKSSFHLKFKTPMNGFFGNLHQLYVAAYLEIWRG